MTDNVTTAAYINHLGGPSPALAQLASALWMEARPRQITRPECTAPSGKVECDSRRAISTLRPLRVATQREPVRVPKPTMGTIHHRQICDNVQHTVANLQQQVCGPIHIGSGCLGPTRLEQAQQFCKSTVPIDTKSYTSRRKPEGAGNSSCPMVASSTVVPEIATPVSCSPTKTTKERSNTWSGKDARSAEKQKVAHICLENMWHEQTQKQQWTSRASQQVAYCLAPSTVATYNTVLKKLQEFCDLQKTHFPPEHSKDIAQFLCEISDKSRAPRSQIKVAMAALSHVYKCYGLFNLLNNYHIQKLVDALVKSGTQTPMLRSKVMPIEPFRKLFKKWPSNADLSIKDLRIKTITLTAVSNYFDVAPF